MLHHLTPLQQDSWALSVAAIRQQESQALFSLPNGTLMTRAGLAAAQLLRAVLPNARKVAVLCGPGNNGGDGLVMARLLHTHGLKVQVHLWGGHGPQADREDALAQAQASGVTLIEGGPLNSDCDCLVDALLGIGLREPPRGGLEEGIAHLRAHGAPVLALDVPSGLDADSGADLGACPASWTLTYLAPKLGLFTGTGRQLAGDIWLSRLGTPEASDGSAQLTGPTSVRRWRALSPRAANSHGGHKGCQGDAWVLAGELGMRGASILAARAALAAGAGRVYWVAPHTDLREPELMQREVIPAGQTVVAGCGGGAVVAKALPSLLHEASQLVLDADALNALALQRDWSSALRKARNGRPTILTPHPLEAARLLDCRTPDIQACRIDSAQRLADQSGCTVVLKGSGTVIAAPSKPCWVNTTGHAALGTAGTGDVLAGWIGGLMAQCPEAPSDELAAIAVAWHGAAADRMPLGSGPLTAGQLISEMSAIYP
jgi:hydroxyethylthiazole kinase-like uncharacterized protein yjeF